MPQLSLPPPLRRLLLLCRQQVLCWPVYPSPVTFSQVITEEVEAAGTCQPLLGVQQEVSAGLAAVAAQSSCSSCAESDG